MCSARYCCRAASVAQAQRIPNHKLEVELDPARGVGSSHGARQQAQRAASCKHPCSLLPASITARSPLGEARRRRVVREERARRATRLRSRLPQLVQRSSRKQHHAQTTVFGSSFHRPWRHVLKRNDRRRRSRRTRARSRSAQDSCPATVPSLRLPSRLFSRLAAVPVLSNAPFGPQHVRSRRTAVVIRAAPPDL